MDLADQIVERAVEPRVILPAYLHRKPPAHPPQDVGKVDVLFQERQVVTWDEVLDRESDIREDRPQTGRDILRDARALVVSLVELVVAQGRGRETCFRSAVDSADAENGSTNAARSAIASDPAKSKTRPRRTNCGQNA